MPTVVFGDDVVTLTAMRTLLLPQFLKQSGSLSGMCASPPGLSSPSVGPMGGSGNSTVTPVEHAGVHPTRKFLAPAPGGSSRWATASKGSEGMGPSCQFVLNMALHSAEVTNEGRCPHGFRSAPDWDASTFVMKSYA
ncbi:MAG TPA: hypothetical protein VNM43_03745 [Dehalococcoidia bacterium]|nr:hypothetical protein [Dehalococcoidia bacterium]